jgi:hypothetical protein
VAVITLVEVKVATLSTTLKLISIYSGKKRTHGTDVVYKVEVAVVRVLVSRAISILVSVAVTVGVGAYQLSSARQSVDAACHQNVPLRQYMSSL